MDTIRSYIDNMFAALPDSERKHKLYGELLANMEERYNELKAQGRSEHEAIGVVISEFGDIGELFAPEEEAQQPLPAATQEAVDRYFAATARYGRLMAWGVALLVFSPAAVILPMKLFLAHGLRAEFAALGMFLLAAAGVAMLIYGGMSLKMFHTLETTMRIPPRLRDSLQQAYEQGNPRSAIAVIAGVCLIVLCPVPPMIMATIDSSLGDISAVLLFLMTALGVQILVRNAKTQSAYRKLLKLGKYAAVRPVR